MTRGVDEEGGKVHQRLEDDTIWMREEERFVCQQTTIPSFGVGRGNTEQVLSIARHAVGVLKTRRSCDDGVF